MWQRSPRIRAAGSSRPVITASIARTTPASRAVRKRRRSCGLKRCNTPSAKPGRSNSTGSTPWRSTRSPWAIRSRGYSMADVPLCPFFKVIGGVRFESTRLSIVNHPEKDATWLPPGASGDVRLNPGDADVSFAQDDVLPSIGFEAKPFEKITVRSSYSETVARQLFKELSPIRQQEYL